MKMSQFGMPPANIIDGLRVPHVFTAESVRSAIQYQPKSDDLFLVTYPKCGTTWAQQILSLIFSQGIPEHSLGEGPFLELKGAQAVETMQRPGFIKTHLPFKLVPWSEEAKYIYIARNPKDCCVSYYYHHLSHRFDGDFNDFFELFFKGDINFGDYFEHLLGWYEHRNDPNFLFLTYEEMKENPDTTVLKMASFIDNEKYAEPLRKDSEKLNSVLKYSSFQYMKEIANENSEDKPKSSEEQSSNSDHSEKTDASSQMGENEFKKGNAGKSISARLVRKGIVGDWRNHFSKEQSKRMDEKFTEKTKGTNIADLWIKCM
ncbi:sulfotransferase 1 family member D1-like [Argiope bruennichi]|uniref:sulfotransferase 1 family member D1-like n=1 Tax=Argiope bruennichi TaxID=94029 RepID=UPI00249556C9|nr:sulfotransferase 1 family member D1-like [Argiope bruennichi]XP_055936145.1 sulfotransferase 1 family member D1-like [Argiope bruennichi]XP_055936146.1 sulfotransferase 1 family member D1-like [Argiope bruennichi]